MQRITRVGLYMEMAQLVSKRSTCSSAKVGAVLVKNNRVIAHGYAGAPSGMSHCLDVGCDLHYSSQDDRNHCLRTVHAEANVVAFAAREGIATAGATMYCTHRPCGTCAKLLINAGIVRVVYLYPYGSEDGLSLLCRAGVIVQSFQHALEEESESQ